MKKQKKNMLVIASLLILTLISINGMVGAEQVSQERESIPIYAPGLYELSLLMIDNKNVFQPGILVERNYFINIPEGFNQEESYDLLIFFHGATTTAQNSIKYSNFTNVSNQEGFIVVFPQSMGVSSDGTVEELFYGDNPEGNVYTCWNVRPDAEPDDEKCYGKRRLPDDDKFIDRIIKRLERKLNIDQIFTAGLSNGGGMAQHIAMAREDIDAIAVGGCSIPGDEMLHYAFDVQNEVRDPFSILRFHGTEDLISEYMYLNHTFNFTNLTMPTAEPAIYLSARISGCSRPPTVEDSDILIELEENPRYDISQVDHWIYEDCEADTEFYSIVGGEHHWYSEISPGIWDFFESQ